MRRLILIPGLLASLSGVAPLAAVQDEGDARPEPWELRVDRGRERLLHLMMNRRARLGIKVSLRARDTDSIGAYVDAVTPGGPADKVGIRSGDIITRLDGQSVLEGGSARRGERAGEERRSVPGLRLIELAARLEPNDTVAVEFRRGKEQKTVTLVTADEPDFLFEGFGPDDRRFVMRAPRRMPFGPARDFHERFGPGEFFGSALADLELAPINPDLGQYFGTKEGILVISVPKDSDLGLKGGDVVLSVDGRRPSSPSHLLRILGSYDRGEQFKLEILRNRKKETVTGRVSERS